MRARKKDGNHHEVVAEFKKMGCVVEDMTAIDNFCDVHVSVDHARFAWVEIKDGNKRLTSGEIKFRDKCQALNEPWFICRSVEDVQGIVRFIKNGQE